jgi:hypothetical protein
MDIVGGGRVHVYPDSDERPHQPGTHENWQESFVIIWYDPKQHVGGLFRLGHEPNFQGGKSQVFINVLTPAGVFHRGAHLPLAPRHRFANGFMSGDDTLRYEYDGKNILWTLKDKDVEVDITVDCFVPPIDAHKREGETNAVSYTGAHVDAGCGITGTVKVKGETYRIDALGIRDHGWGTRDWNSLLSHRWNWGTFDKNNSFVTQTYLSTPNKHAKFGWVIRDGKVIMSDKVEVLALIGEDGATNFGGYTRMTLTTGEVVEARFEPYYPCLATWVHQTICYDSLCRVTWGDRIGVGVFETSCNIQGGSIKPEVYDGSIGPDGWHKAHLLLA